MKKLFKFIGVCCLSAVLAMVVGIGMMLVTDNDSAIIGTMIFGGVLIALALGAFSDRKKNARIYDTIKHKTGFQNAA